MAEIIWRSPAPYLLLSIAIIMAIIAVALIMLICTHRKSSNGDSLSSIEKAVVQVSTDSYPQIVIIMAGDDTPSFVAKPVSIL
ncbi:protein GLUTAMINE DUMPER 5-like protein [Carex littledalei]|uniref:Protein GLUTAMINE DUMPER 5-like protein n=1 Tax=Carex littledalei TaxID=544730 RepID=A0A833RB54_9POAL|nr:protein GLUTAMINE DUMPER 5-like protein [Carex littledalei]